MSPKATRQPGQGPAVQGGRPRRRRCRRLQMRPARAHLRARPARKRPASRYVATFTSVPTGVYGQTFAAAPIGSSTQPTLCGTP